MCVLWQVGQGLGVDAPPGYWWCPEGQGASGQVLSRDCWVRSSCWGYLQIRCWGWLVPGRLVTVGWRGSGVGSR